MPLLSLADCVISDESFNLLVVDVVIIQNYLQALLGARLYLPDLSTPNLVIRFTLTNDIETELIYTTPKKKLSKRVYNLLCFLFSMPQTPAISQSELMSQGQELQ